MRSQSRNNRQSDRYQTDACHRQETDVLSCPGYQVFLLAVIFLVCLPAMARAQFTFIQDTVLADSEEPFSDRIYYYDMDIDSRGKAHVIYALPQQDRVHSHIKYAVETDSGWQQTTISTDGKYIPAGIQLAVAPDDSVTMTYITGSNDYDSALVYRTISADGTLNNPITVSGGGWRSRLQLTSQGEPVIVREAVSGLSLFTWANGQFNQQAIQLPVSSQVRLGAFHIDSHGGCHVLFGDWAYPQTNSHNLWYAFSASATGGSWEGTRIDSSGQLYELEFWVDLTTDTANTPIAAMFGGDTRSSSKTPTWGVFFRQQNDGTWTSTKATRHQENSCAGMGPGLASDQYGYYGVWDNSPPSPYEHESRHGAIFCRFSPDGSNWKVGEMLASYSAEGRCVVRLKNGILSVLVLGDYTDAKLHFFQYRVPGDQIFDFYPDRMMYHQNEDITFNLLMRGTDNVDLYAVCLGRNTGKIFQLSADMQWHAIQRIEQITPVLSDFQLQSFNDTVMTVPATAVPASVRDIFDCYSVAASPGSNVLSGDWRTPLYHRYIYSNWP